jgi:hypothetical protein
MGSAVSFRSMPDGSMLSPNPSAGKNLVARASAMPIKEFDTRPEEERLLYLATRPRHGMSICEARIHSPDGLCMWPSCSRACIFAVHSSGFCRCCSPSMLHLFFACQTYRLRPSPITCWKTRVLYCDLHLTRRRLFVLEHVCAITLSITTVSYRGTAPCPAGHACPHWYSGPMKG